MKKKTNKISLIAFGILVAIIFVGTIIIIKNAIKNIPEDKIISDVLIDNFSYDDTDTANFVTVRTDYSEGFKAVNNRGIFAVSIKHSDKSYVEITTTPELQKYVTTTIDEGTLYLEGFSEKGNSQNRKFDKLPKCNITIYTPVCEKIKNEGIGSIICDSISGTNIEIENEGIGKIKVNNIIATNISIENEGVGDVVANIQSCENMEISNDGVGNVTANTNSCKMLEVSNDGFGKITISGNANKANLSNDGTGSINASDLKCANLSTQNVGFGKIITPKD